MPFDPFRTRTDHPQKECAADGCTANFRDTGRWAPERQSKSGWFHQRNGSSFCPQHTPDWVAAWRERKASK